MVELRRYTWYKLIWFAFGISAIGLYFWASGNPGVPVHDGVLAAGLFVVFLLASYVWTMRQQRQWTQAARAAGLSPVGPDEPWVFERELSGRRIRVRSVNPRRDSDPDDHTLVSTPLGDAPGDLDVQIRTRAPLERPGSAVLGAGDDGAEVLTGDEAFDARFRVRAADPERARSLLTLGVRQELAAVGGDLAVRIDGDQVVLDLDRRVLDPEQMQAAVEAVARVAEATVGSSGR